MIGNARKAALRRKALKLKGIMENDELYFSMSHDQMADLIQSYTDSLSNDEERDYFFSMAFFGSIRIARRAKKITEEIEKFLEETRELPKA